MQELGLESFAAYRKYLIQNPPEWKHLDLLCDITISRFYRDKGFWHFLEEEIIPEFLRSDQTDTLSFWSAGCCNGEEPYTLAMIMDQMNKKSTIANFRILATDRNPQVIERAKTGVYPKGALKELPDKLRNQYFQPNKRVPEHYQISESIRKLVEFEQSDIRDSFPERQFDIVFCRNLVFMYFSTEQQKQFTDYLYDHIKNDGYLVLGCHEELPDTDKFERIIRSHPVYKRVSD